MIKLIYWSLIYRTLLTIVFCPALSHRQFTVEYHTPVQAEQCTENSELVVVSVPAHLNTTPHQCTDQHLWSSELVITHLTRHSTAVDQQPHPPVYAGVGPGEQDGLLPAE